METFTGSEVGFRLNGDMRVYEFDFGKIDYSKINLPTFVGYGIDAILSRVGIGDQILTADAIVEFEDPENHSTDELLNEDILAKNRIALNQLRQCQGRVVPIFNLYSITLYPVGPEVESPNPSPTL